MEGITSIELIFLSIMGALILTIVISGLWYFLDSRRKSKSKVQASLDSVELINRIEKLETNYNEILETLNGIEDYFSSMMYQIDDLSKNNKQSFQKIQDYLMFLQQVKNSNTKSNDSYYDIMNINQYKEEYKEQFAKDDEIKAIVEENDLSEVFKRSQQIERAEMRTDDVGEMAKELNMSRGEIELVKQLNQIKEKVDR
jgi:hypothetical protein